MSLGSAAPRSLDCTERKSQHEGAAGARICFRRYVPPVKTRHLTRQVETQTGAANRRGVGIHDPAELLKQHALLVGLDSDSLISDLHTRQDAVYEHLALDLSSVRRVLDRVVEQVMQDGGQNLRVGPDRDSF